MWQVGIRSHIPVVALETVVIWPLMDDPAEVITWPGRVRGECLLNARELNEGCQGQIWGVCGRTLASPPGWVPCVAIGTRCDLWALWNQRYRAIHTIHTIHSPQSTRYWLNKRSFIWNNADKFELNSCWFDGIGKWGLMGCLVEFVGTDRHSLTGWAGPIHPPILPLQTHQLSGGMQ